MDFFGNIFAKFGMDMIKDGLQSAFMGDGSNRQQRQQAIPPSFANAMMGVDAASPAGQGQEIKVANYDVVKSMWDRRLFGNESYTNITIPRINV